MLSAVSSRIIVPRRFLSCICFLLPAIPALGQARPTTTEINTLLHLNGSVAIISQLGPVMAQQVIAAMRKANPALPARADAVVSNVVETYVQEEAARDTVTNFLVPIYRKYLTENDVKQLIRFYRTPIGRKFAQVTPPISFESTIAGQQWAESIAPGLQARLLEALKTQGIGQ